MAFNLSSLVYEPLVRAALAEDMGPGDITTELCIDAGATAEAALLAKSAGTVAGLDVARCAFRMLDAGCEWTPLVADGAHVDGRRTPLARVAGNARALLTAERVALNFMQRMSGVATFAALCVEQVKGTNARIVDTRKTTPLLRALEKYSVRVGGGFNHRTGLYDAVLIKDNHIKAAGGIGPAVRLAKAQAPHTMKVEAEASDMQQVKDALYAGADIILLDNMTTAQMAEAVQFVGGQALTEASGGLTLARVAEVAATGVDVLSVGALTHSAPAMDISLDFQ